LTFFALKESVRAGCHLNTKNSETRQEQWDFAQERSVKIDTNLVADHGHCPCSIGMGRGTIAEEALAARGMFAYSARFTVLQRRAVSVS
jgi:hypothetical protein